MTLAFNTYSELYPGRFLKADLFNGQPATFTIRDIFREELEGEKGKEAKIILSFQETPLQYVLPKINAECIKAMFGPSVPGWIGKRITWFGTTSIMPNPKRPSEPCIRVFGSPDIDKEITHRWTPPRRREITQVLQPTESPVVTAALSAIAKATDLTKLEATVSERLDQGQITEKEATLLRDAIRARKGNALPSPAPAPSPQPAPARAARPPQRTAPARVPDIRSDVTPAPPEPLTDAVPDPVPDSTGVSADPSPVVLPAVPVLDSLVVDAVTAAYKALNKSDRTRAAAIYAEFIEHFKLDAGTPVSKALTTPDRVQFLKEKIGGQ